MPTIVQSRQRIVQAAILTILVGAPPLQAQDHTSRESSPFHHREVRLSLMSVGNANEASCGRGTGGSAGLALTSSGPWYVRGAADVFLTWADECPSGLRILRYQGRSVEVWGSTEFVFAPRIAVSIGRRVRIAGVRVDARVGTGLLRTLTNYGPRRTDESMPRRSVEVATWEPWFGGTVGLGILPKGVTLEAELGLHGVRARYYAVADDELVREFGTRRLLTRLGVSVPF